MISLLFAMDENRVIGFQNDLPWHLPKDLRFFKEKTTGQTIIMGRKTCDSMNGPLPNRENVVITRNKEFQQEGVSVIHSIDDVLKWNKKNPEKEYFVTGGEDIFEQFLPHAERMYMTLIEETFPGDTHFPVFNEKEWIETSKVKGEKDERNPYDYYFIQLDRK